jgi:hypothetical protein
MRRRCGGGDAILDPRQVDACEVSSYDKLLEIQHLGEQPGVPKRNIGLEV